MNNNRILPNSDRHIGRVGYRAK